MKSKKHFLDVFSLLGGVLMLCVSLGLSSCSSSDSEPEPELSVYPSSIKLAATGGESQEFDIACNTNWILAVDESWLDVSSRKGNGDETITVSAEDNTESTARTATVTITAGDIQKKVKVTQAAGLSLELDKEEVTLMGSANSSVTINITCNSAWEISGAPSWLTLSSNSGNGNSSVTLTANSENYSASTRECKLNIVSGSKSCQCRVVQNGTLASNCTVTPNIIVCLANGFAFDYTYGKNVAYYYVKLYNPREIERKTDAEIIAEMSADASDRDTPNDDYVTSWKNLSPVTEYAVCTVAFDKNGNHGELVKTKIKTKSGTNQACAYISDVTYTASYFHWNSTVNGYVKKYYRVYFDSGLYNASDAALAWFAKKWIEENPSKYTAAVQSGSWSVLRNGDTSIGIMTWAKNEEDEYSGVIDRYVGYIKSSSKQLQTVKSQGNQSPFKAYKNKKQ